ncbi:plastocyanin/azurin family domain-containing protein [Methylophaga lonarensis MPL]|uniref:Plastocyanin/azurin family domain-containing protein n=2 Tax=Methylophaga lonarensis TaxID=999151 RepID=M7NWK7_9GAMM|nr:plastocyanin/azurin family domain-containing protein [Methylophaga lonarensis MPL]
MDRLMKHLPALVMAVGFCTVVSAETMIDMQIHNHLQQPLPGAVIEIEVTEPEARSSTLHIIDQVNKAFVPEFLVIKAGDEIDFPNSDNIRHHVYSFSEAKTFELRLYADRPERPVDFPNPGVVLIGCNIHDSMIGYIYVANSRNVAVSDETGRARLSVPEGLEAVTVTIWHPEQSSSPELRRTEKFTQDDLTALISLSVETLDVLPARDTFGDKFSSVQ